MSADKYIDAIEMNYSHEQMNPLNCILGNSKIVLKRFMQITKQLDSTDKVEYNEETIKILNSINFAGQIMWYYNLN
jgi:hypothetical protein